jgi:hypothetical protein
MKIIYIQVSKFVKNAATSQIYSQFSRPTHCSKLQIVHRRSIKEATMHEAVAFTADIIEVNDHKFHGIETGISNMLKGQWNKNRLENAIIHIRCMRVRPC